jgi:hypothetical protein
MMTRSLSAGRAIRQIPAIPDRRSQRCSSADEWFTQSPFDIQIQADFDAIPEADWDDYVRSTTAFTGWQGMLQKAGASYVERKLFT